MLRKVTKVLKGDNSECSSRARHESDNFRASSAELEPKCDHRRLCPSAIQLVTRSCLSRPVCPEEKALRTVTPLGRDVPQEEVTQAREASLSPEVFFPDTEMEL